MKVSYKKLWKLLIDRDMKKKDLQLAAGLSSTTIAKLSNHENVSMDVLIKVCTILGFALVTLWNWFQMLNKT